MKILILFLWLTLPFQALTQEEDDTSEPEAEFPYPQNIPNNKYNSKQQPKRKTKDGAYIYDTSTNLKKWRKIEGVQQPSQFSSDGSIVYDDDEQPSSAASKKAPLQVEAPYTVGEDGVYYYKKKSNLRKNKMSGVTQPLEVEKDGTFRYLDPDTDYNRAMFFRLGVIGPYDVRGSATNSRSYRDIYSSSGEFLLNFEYEWVFWMGTGRATLKLGSGISLVQGQGQFVNNTDKIPRESYQFLLTPNLILVNYKLELTPTQKLVPYVDGGGGYFAFMERRSDDNKNAFGGAPVLSAALGLLIPMEPFGLTADREDGYNRLWFDLQYRQIFGLDARKDFSSSAITGGISLGF